MSQQYPPQYPPQYPQYQSAPPETSTSAIIALIGGILGLVGVLPLIGSIVGIIAGNSAKNDIRNRPGQVTGEGLAQAGVVLGWVGLVLWGIGCCAAVLAFTVFGVAIPGVGICAALGNGNSISRLQLLPMASVLAVPIYLKLRP